jgi:hypothetical protein
VLGVHRMKVGNFEVTTILDGFLEIDPRLLNAPPEMVKKLVQASGRSTRDFDDHSVTYILDAGFTTAWRQWHSIMPDWFKERVSLVE